MAGVSFYNLPAVSDLLLLDKYPATTAYSLRKLRKTYTGNAIRVRRSSDNTEQDIGFTTSGNLNQGALATFCSGTNGFVTTWYDQQGSHDATQTNAANQPKIYDSSTGLLLKNGRPALDFDGGGDLMTATITGMRNFTNLSLFTTMSPDLASAANISTQVVFGYGAGGADTSNRGIGLGPATSVINGETICFFFASNTTGGRLGSTTYAHSAGEQLLHSQFYLSTGTSIFKNGAAITLNLTFGITTNTNTSPSACNVASDLFHIASINGVGANASQMVQEMIVYGSNQSTNRTAIETNINNYYNIYP